MFVNALKWQCSCGQQFVNRANMLIMKQRTKKIVANSQFQKRTIAFKYCDNQLTCTF